MVAGLSAAACALSRDPSEVRGRHHLRLAQRLRLRIKFRLRKCLGLRLSLCTLARQRIGGLVD